MNDGGPAFPTHDSEPFGDFQRDVYASPGMSLRDYLAGQALVGLMSAPHAVQAAILQKTGLTQVQLAYVYAKGMMEVREEIMNEEITDPDGSEQGE